MEQKEYEEIPTTAPKPARLFTTVFVAIVGVTLCGYICGQGLNSGTSVYIDRLGGTATLSGIGAAVFSAAAIVGRLVSGPLSDTRGRLVVIVSGAVILLVGVLGAALSANIDLIMVWRILQGVGFSIVTTATATARYDLQGHRLASPRRGLNIIRMSDGTVRKVVVK